MDYPSPEALPRAGGSHRFVWGRRSFVGAWLILTPLPGCERDDPPPKASVEPASIEPAAAETESEPEVKPAATDSLAERGVSKRTIAKTQKVLAEAADPLAGEANAVTLDADPEIAAARKAALGKVLEAPEGSLDGLYAALARTEVGGGDAITRVLHIGDSFIGQDVLPHAIRRRLQRRFGNAGPGFQVVDLFHRANVSRVIDLTSSGWDTCYIAKACLGKNGWYGIGGHAARGRRGAKSWLTPRDPTPFDDVGGHAEVWYRTAERGAKIAVDAGDAETIIDTRSEAPADAWKTIALEPDNLEVELQVRGNGLVHAYGVVFEADRPGVVWDALPMTGAYSNRMLNFEREHIAGQVAHRDPDLLVVNFGGNDLQRVARGTISQEGFQQELENVIQLLRSGKPSMSCLVVGSTDHFKVGRTRVKAENVETLVAAQRGAARAQNCAFFDSLATFGGTGVVAKWARHRPPVFAGDLSHLSPLGRELLADVLVSEIVAGYVHSRGATD